MANDKPKTRRSTRLANTPKIDYKEEKKIDLKEQQPSSSSRKRRDTKNSDDKKRLSKKIKLRHEEKVVADDDEETIVSEFDYESASDDSANDQLYFLNDDDETDDDDQTEIESAADYSIDDDDDDDYLSEDSSTDREIDVKNSRESLIKFMSLDFPDELLQNNVKKPVDEDEEGFLIQIKDDDETATNPPLSSQQVNQNILDVTDYDKFNDESTNRKDDGDHIVKSERENTPNKRKGFVKKNKKNYQQQADNNSNKIIINKLVKHVDEDKVNFDSSQLTQTDNDISRTPVKGSQVLMISTRKKKTEMKTNFADFFRRSETIDVSKDSIKLSDQSSNQQLLTNEKSSNHKPPIVVESSLNESAFEATTDKSLDESVVKQSNIVKNQPSSSLPKQKSPEYSPVIEQQSTPSEEAIVDKTIASLTASSIINESTVPIKRKRGRPRKSDASMNQLQQQQNSNSILKHVSKSSSPQLQPSLSPPTPPKIESDNEINVIKVVDKSNKSTISSPKNGEEINNLPILNDKDDIKLNNSIQSIHSIEDDDNIIVLDKKEDDLIISSSIKSDDPWTVKYKPLNSDQVLDNKSASKAIKDWIYDFTTKSPSSRFYDDDEDEDDENFPLESCVLITGPTGCGKTSMVYAIAEELDYKVFEINCSSRRNSKFINQIKEATLSHTVSRHSGSTNNSPVKINPPKKTTLADPKQRNLFNFFQKKLTTTSSSIVDESSISQDDANDLKALSINKNSLILFDDVDVIFEEDGGFWQALSFLIENTKRPIILTATNSIESIKQELKRALCVQMTYPTMSTLNNHLRDIVFKECYNNSSSVDVIKTVDCCVNRNEKGDHDYNKSPILDKHIEKIELISKDNHCDIRSCVNRLQFDFSSVNITTYSNQDHHHHASVSTNEESKEAIVSQLISSNDDNEINLSTYNNLILSDLFQMDTHPKNSRDELNNSCTYDETFKSKDLRESILNEFNRLNSAQFKLNLNERIVDCIDDMNWLSKFNQCTDEVKEHLPLALEHDFNSDYLPYLSVIMKLEQERLELFIKHTRRARRFLHYLDNIQFHLSDSVQQFLKETYLHRHFFNDDNTQNNDK